MNFQGYTPGVKFQAMGLSVKGPGIQKHGAHSKGVTEKTSEGTSYRCVTRVKELARDGEAP